jgi:hypothetical protein
MTEHEITRAHGNTLRRRLAFLTHEIQHAHGEYFPATLLAFKRERAAIVAELDFRAVEDTYQRWLHAQTEGVA